MKTYIAKRRSLKNQRIRLLYLRVFDHTNGFRKDTYKSLKMFEYVSPRTTKERKHNVDVKLECQKQLLHNYITTVKKEPDVLFFECIEEFAKDKLINPIKKLLQFIDPGLAFKEINEIASPKSIYKLRSEFQKELNNKNFGKLKESTYATYWSEIRSIIRKCYPVYLDKYPNYFGSLKYKITSKSHIIYNDEDLKRLWNTPVFDPRGYHKMKIDEKQIKNACFFMLYTGLRASDIIDLDWSNISRSNDTTWNVFITQRKTGKKIINSFPRCARDLLGIRNRGKIFTDLQGSNYIHSYRSRFYDRFVRWRNRAGVSKEKTLHTFRHTYANNLYKQCGNIYEVSRALGHSKLETTLSFYAPAEVRTNENAKHIEKAYNFL